MAAKEHGGEKTVVWRMVKTHPCLLNVLIGSDLDQLRFPLMPACFSEPHNS
jgi:hypothetical protein